MSTYPEFGVLLNQQLNKLDRSPAWLAQRLGFNQGTVSRWLNNGTRPGSPEVVVRIADILGMVTRVQELLVAAGYGYQAGKTEAKHTREKYQRQSLQDKSRQIIWPKPPTELIGRAQEVELLCRRLQTHRGRLLTLIGPPGIGKTRLSLAVAEQLESSFADGIYFVPLAAVTDVEVVASTLVAALGISEIEGRSPQAKLINFFRHKQALLLLDNFEQIAAAAPLVAELLEAAPDLNVLVTSRERLHLRAEQRYRVQPLEVASAVALFVQRAQLLEADFALTTENQAIVTELCQRLDCLPLAIELCAARIDLMTPQALLARLHDHRLDLLSDGPRDMPPHQRTLRIAIHRSYDLLSEQESRHFRTLGVFVDGFDVEASAALGVDESTLQSLAHKSLVQLGAYSDENARFLLLETLREFAWEQLCAQGEAEAVQSRHADYFLRLAEEAAAHLRGFDQALWLERLATEQANCRAALTWSLANGRIDTSTRLAFALWRFWYSYGHSQEGRQWLERVLAQAETPTQRANLLYALGMLVRSTGDTTTAVESLTASLALYRGLEDRSGIASSLRGLGFIHYLQDDFAGARPLLEEALDLFRALNDLDGIAVTLDNLAYISNDPVEEQNLYQESLAIRRRSGNLRGMAMSLTGLAYIAINQEEFAAARRYAEEHMRIVEALGNQYRLARAVSLLGRIALAEGDYTEARRLYEKSVEICQATGDRLHLPACMLGMGQALVKLGEYERARLLFGQAIVLYAARNSLSDIAFTLLAFATLAVALGRASQALSLIGAITMLCETIGVLADSEMKEAAQVEATARQVLGEEAAAVAWAVGQRMSVEEVVAFALAESAETANNPNAKSPEEMGNERGQ